MIGDAALMATDITKIVNAILSKAPDWLRRDLSSENGQVRQRAEETLTAMIAAALNQDETTAN